MNKKLEACIVKNNGITLHHTNNNSLGTLRFNKYSKSLEYSIDDKWNTVIHKFNNMDNIMLGCYTEDLTSKHNIFLGNNYNTSKHISSSIILGNNITPSSNSIHFGNIYSKTNFVKDNIIFGHNSYTKSEQNIIFGNNNIVNNNSIFIGNNHNCDSSYSIVIGDSDSDSLYFIKDSLNISFNNKGSYYKSTLIGLSQQNGYNNNSNTIIGLNTDITGEKNTIFGVNNNIYSNNSVILGTMHLLKIDKSVQCSNINLNQKSINLGYKSIEKNSTNHINIGYLGNNSNNNISIGYKAGENIFSINNILVGNHTGQNCHNSNLIIGNNNGRFIGDNSVILGANIGKNNTGNNNVLIGYDITQLDSSNNTIIGYSNASLISGNNNIIIGNNNINNNKTNINDCITLGYQCLKNDNINEHNNVFEIRNKYDYILGNINNSRLDLYSLLKINNVILSPNNSLSIKSNNKHVKLDNVIIKNKIIKIKYLTIKNIVKIVNDYDEYYINKSSTFVLVFGKSVTLYLPKITDNIGKLYYIKQLNSQVSKIKTLGTNLIANKSSYLFKSQNSSITLMPYKNNWIIVDKYNGNNNSRYKVLLHS